MRPQVRVRPVQLPGPAPGDGRDPAQYPKAGLRRQDLPGRRDAGVGSAEPLRSSGAGRSGSGQSRSQPYKHTGNAP